jgi:uncharacterized protein YjiS (DUF1127 family)
MTTSLRSAYASFSRNRSRYRNTWILAAMENAFLQDIGMSRVEIQFPVRNATVPLYAQEMLRNPYEIAS